jgi:hypothetical protein
MVNIEITPCPKPDEGCAKRATGAKGRCKHVHIFYPGDYKAGEERGPLAFLPQIATGTIDRVNACLKTGNVFDRQVDGKTSGEKHGRRHGNGRVEGVMLR